MEIIQKLRDQFSGEISDNGDILARYSHDASIFEVRPSAIVYPEHTEDIRSLVRFANKMHAEGTPVSLTARAAGTCMSGGSLSSSIVIDVTRHMNAVSDIKNNSVSVGPGTFYRDLERAVKPLGLMLPSYTASKDICTVGGMVANNAGGEKSLTFGNTERYVASLNVVLSDGTPTTMKRLSREELAEKMQADSFEGSIYRDMHALITKNLPLIQASKPKVSKNSAGYLLWNVYNPNDGSFDLAQLMVGSQGTLGLITDITLSLVPISPYKQLLAITLDSLENLPKVVSTVLSAGPESFESYDEHTFRLAEEYMPSIARSVITKKESAITLIAEFTGQTQEDARAKAEKALSALREFMKSGVVVETEDEAENYWKIRRSSFRLLRDHSEGNHRVAPFIDDIIVTPEKLAEFLPALRAILEKYRFTYTLAGHIGNGNFHIIPLVNMCDETNRLSIIDLAKEVFALTFSFGGSMAGEHNDGIIRTPFVKQMFGEEMYRLFEETKQIFDPKNILNPGKKVGGSIEYAIEHFSKTNFCEHL